MTTIADAPELRVAALMQERDRAARAFFPAHAERIARLCHQMAERFARGGRLLALGEDPVARSDVRHVAVEFVHPVIVGKRALPAIGLGPEGGSIACQAKAMAEPDDIAIAFGAGELAPAVAAARDAGCLTVAFGAAGAQWSLEPPSTDPHVRQELVETTYHVLWELVHVFFEHRGLLEGRDGETTHDAGASSFLYPFLAEREDDLQAVVEDVRRSVLMKADEAGALRTQTLRDGADALNAAAAELRPALAAGARVLALGNGGSATDAMDAVADLRALGHRALDLTEDAAILTAIANDVGVEALFARQVIAHARAGDTVLTFSTSGNSTNVIAALAEARRRGLRTIALVGYDGGRIAAEGLADHLVVTRSQHIPRIQEAQATAWHALLGLLGGGR
jgi:D-sedoheptulose 7-phosphate isomerase